MEKATGKKEPPKTMDEMFEAAKKITRRRQLAPIGLCLGRIADTPGNRINMIWGDGGAYVDKDGKPPSRAKAP